MILVLSYGVMRVSADTVAALAILISILLVGCAGDAQVIDNTPTLTPLEAQGKALFDQYCDSCHSTAGETVVVGPSLAGVAQRASSRVPGLSPRAYLEQSISDPSLFVVEGFKDQMPDTLAKTIAEEERDALVAYLLTLR